MASSSRSSSQGSCPAPGGAPPTDDAPHAALELAAEAEQVVRTGDDYVEKLQDQIRAPDAQIRALQQPSATDGKAHVLQEPRAADAAKAHALQQPMAAADAADTAKAHALQQPMAAADAADTAKAHAAHGSGTSGRGVTRQVSRRRELGKQDVLASKRVRNNADVNTMVPRTSYRALRMRPESPPQSSREESFDEGDVGNDPPKHKSLRMNATSGFQGRSASQAKQPRRRS